MIAVRLVRTVSLLILGLCLAVTIAHGVWADDSAGTALLAAAAAPHSPSPEQATSPQQLSPSTQALLASLTIFVLAMFEGFDVITKVPPTLHTPLMSGSNAISGITVVGSIVAAGSEQVGLATFLGTIAVAFAMINVVGGFLVTHRMLKMFKKK
jgi:H+-translocating NAD(P) transhydrogenase subunit alpha